MNMVSFSWPVFVLSLRHVFFRLNKALFDVKFGQRFTHAGDLALLFAHAGDLALLFALSNQALPAHCLGDADRGLRFALKLIH